MNPHDIPRIETLDRHRFQNHYIPKGEPVIVTGHRLTKTDWSLEYLASKHRQHKVEIEFYADGDRNKVWSYEVMTIADYLDKIRDPQQQNRYYLTGKTLAEMLPNVVEDMVVPSFVPDGATPIAFVGINTYTNAHYHPPPLEAVLTQVVGRKNLVLWPSRVYKSLYPFPWYSMRNEWSRIPFESMATPAAHTGNGRPWWLSEDDARRFPDVATAPRYECVLNAGEMLFIPQGWFHVVHGLGESISVTYFFRGSLKHSYFPIAFRDRVSMVEKHYVIPPLLAAAKSLGMTDRLMRLGSRLGVID